MRLKILLPFQIFSEHGDVLSIVAETRDGSFGILPHRLDCVAALVPGILIFKTASTGEVLVAVDEGVLVKTGTAVSVSVRRAINGTDLGRLRSVVVRDYMTLDESEKNARSVVARLETGFLSHLARLKHG
jgi:F-type H+-transporting ATPase subunit epsilon